MIKILSKKKKEKYIASKGIRCPFCEGEFLEGGSVEIDGGGAYQKITCLDCNKAWVDHYDLTGIEILE